MMADNTTIEGACGVGTWCNFEPGWGEDITNRPSAGGAGWHFVMYVVGIKPHAKFYDLAAKRWPIIYQSEIRYNLNSGNDVFFCIYDTSKDPVGVGFDKVDNFGDDDE